MKRQPFATRMIRLISKDHAFQVQRLVENVPIDPETPLEVVIREVPKVRKPDANSRMWAGQLKDIAEQAWVEGRQFSAEVWHEFFKREYLPEDNDPHLAELVKDPESWRKWDVDPRGNRVCVGSTTRLTIRGFALYLQQVEAYGAQLGVRYHEAPNRWGS